MAIAFDASTMAGWSATGSSSFSGSHTFTGSDGFLVVQVTTANFSTGTPTPSVTYGGVAMTPLVVNKIAYTTNNWRYHFFYLKNPSTGTNTVAITCASGTGIIRFVASSYTGVDQTAPLLTSNTVYSTSGNTILIPLTTTEDAWWIIGGVTVDGNWVSTSYNTHVIRQATGASGLGDSDGVVTAQAGYNQMARTVGSRGYVGAAIAIKPASGGSSYRFVPQIRPFA